MFVINVLPPVLTSLREINERIGELLKHSIKSEGIINLFADSQREFSLFDPKLLEEIAAMRQKNLAAELLSKLINEQISVYKRTNLVQSLVFSEKMQQLMNQYRNGQLSNAEVIDELLRMASEIAKDHKAGEKMGLSIEEKAFYDAITKPEAIKDFYDNDALLAITKELTEMLRKNRTVDWKKRNRKSRNAVYGQEVTQKVQVSTGRQRRCLRLCLIAMRNVVGEHGDKLSYLYLLKGQGFVWLEKHSENRANQ